MQKYAESEKQRIIALANEVGPAEASRQTGVPSSTVAWWLREARHASQKTFPSEPEAKDTVNGTQDTGAKDIRIAGLQAEVERLKAGSQEDTPTATWAYHESKTSRSIEKHEHESIYDIHMEDERPIGMTFVSDQHIGAKLCDMRRMREDAELIQATEGLYAVLGGDSTDNHLLIREAMIASEVAPETQYELFEHYLSIFQPSIISLIAGNHCQWTARVSGIDMIRRLAEKHRIHYGKQEVLLRVHLGSQVYRILARHNTRWTSALNTLHGSKRQWDLGNFDYDIMFSGHIHSAAIEKFTRHRVDRWAAVAGSYQITSSYSTYGGFPDSRPTCPTFILYPTRRHIVGFDCVRDAAGFLNHVRSRV